MQRTQVRARQEYGCPEPRTSASAPLVVRFGRPPSRAYCLKMSINRPLVVEQKADHGPDIPLSGWRAWACLRPSGALLRRRSATSS